MNNSFEYIYQTMFDKIKKEGNWSSNKVRTKYSDNTPALRKQIIGYQFRYDNSTNIPPLVKSRFIPIKSAITEMYWIWFMQSNRVQDLRDLGCKYWDEWEKTDGTIGPSYGYQLSKNTFGHQSQLHYVIHELENNPDSTRIMTELWNVDDIADMALTPCIHLTQWSVVDGNLILEVRARSQDFALGLCSNIYQYSILHKLVAHECGLQPGEIIYTIHNLHYYDRHEELLEKQFAHYNQEIINTSLDSNPKVIIDYPKSIFEFKPSDVSLYSNNNLFPKYYFEIAI